MYEGVGESGICLLACCCTPTVGACILSWAHVPPLSLKEFSRNLPTLPRSTEPPGMYEGVGESGICLLACCCTPTVGACLVVMAMVMAW